MSVDVEHGGGWTTWRTRFVLFTGKGGVGKTTAAAALAVALASEGRRVLIVSTDPASNLSGVFETPVADTPTAVAGVDGLDAMDIDPVAAADAYRQRVLGPLRDTVPEADLAAMVEQLSGQCTVEVAAFDEFSGLLATPEVTAAYDHVIFDTAPTGHTLRLLELPAAWSTFIDANPEGASCLGPLSALGEKRTLYRRTVEALGDADQTTVVLVARPEPGAIREAARAASELAAQGVSNQRLILNGVLTSPEPGDDLPQTTPVQEAADLQDDLRRAGIEPYGWVVNASLAASHTTDPVLRRRAALEMQHIREVRELAASAWIIPWETTSTPP